MAIEDLDIEPLILDPDNPRLPNFVGREQGVILEYLTRSSAVDELIDAIGENGYFADEPIIGVREHDGGVVTIVEGNRRLTALKLLARYRDYSDEDIDKETTLPAKVRNSLKAAKHHPETVPVAIHTARESVLVYLGNKHIAGVKPWGSLAKAKYVQQLMDQPQFQDGNFSERVRNVARSIGSRSDYIKRALRALQAYNDARDHDYFGLQGLTEDKVKFSRLSSALDYSGIISFATGEDEPEYPVAYNMDELRDLFKWLFVEDDDGNTVVGDTRNLRQLSNVLEKPEALMAIRRGKTLTAAYRMTSSLGADFDKMLSDALTNLQSANAIAPEIDASEPRIDDANALFKQARALRSTLESS